MPMVRMRVTPAAAARSRISVEIVGEALMIEVAVGIDEHLFKARAHGDFFEEARQHGLAAFERGRDDHAVRLDAP